MLIASGCDVGAGSDPVMGSLMGLGLLLPLLDTDIGDPFFPNFLGSSSESAGYLVKSSATATAPVPPFSIRVDG